MVRTKNGNSFNRITSTSQRNVSGTPIRVGTLLCDGQVVRPLPPLAVPMREGHHDDPD